MTLTTAECPVVEKPEAQPVTRTGESQGQLARASRSLGPGKGCRPSSRARKAVGTGASWHREGCVGGLAPLRQTVEHEQIC